MSILNVKKNFYFLLDPFSINMEAHTWTFDVASRAQSGFEVFVRRARPRDEGLNFSCRILSSNDALCP